MNTYFVSGAWNTKTKIKAMDYDHAMKISIQLLKKRFIDYNEKNNVFIYQNNTRVSVISFNNYVNIK